MSAESKVTDRWRYGTWQHGLLSRMDSLSQFSFLIGSADKRKFGHFIRLLNTFTTSWLPLTRGVRRDGHSRYTKDRNFFLNGTQVRMRRTLKCMKSRSEEEGIDSRRTARRATEKRKLLGCLRVYALIYISHVRSRLHLAKAFVLILG